MAFLKVFLLALALVLLPGCDTSHSVSGEIVEYHADAQDHLTALVIRTDEGELIGLVPEEDGPTGARFWLGADTVSEFRTEYPLTVLVSAKCHQKPTTLTRQDGSQIAAYTAEWVMDTDHLTQRSAYTFSDGVSADLWENWPYHSYRLADGTVLLRVSPPPEDPLPEDLSPAARSLILAFYEEQGLLYDEEEELERVYQFYRADVENFSPLLAEQNAYTAFDNGQVLSLCTAATLPQEPGYCYELRLTHSFDRETGEQISNYDLFTVSPEELLDLLLERAGYENWENAPSMEELRTALRPEYIHLSQDRLDITYPRGTLPSQAHSYGFGLSYFGQEWDILQPWAQPNT